MDRNRLLATSALCLTLLMLTNGALAVNCPPNQQPALLSLERPDWIIAAVSVVEQPADLPYQAALVKVDTVFAGQLNATRATILPSPNFDECGGSTLIPTQEIGSRWLIGTQGPNADGTYGGYALLKRLPIEADTISGVIPGFQQDGESRSLEEFAAFVNERTPRAKTDNYLLSMEPRLPGPSDPVALKVVGNLSCVASTNAVRVDKANASIKISFESPSIDITPCLPLSNFTIQLPALGKPVGQDYYRVDVFYERVSEGNTPFRSDQLIAGFDYAIRAEPSLLANPEVPANGSLQSGVGVIRGWACEAETIDVQFDDRAPIRLAHGTLRTDTREVCGDTNNGYGAVYAWGLLGAGQHTMRTFIDNQLVETVNFEVAGLEEAFAQGLEAEFELADFPAPGQSTTVRWSEAAQNFIIVDTSP